MEREDDVSGEVVGDDEEFGELGGETKAW